MLVFVLVNVFLFTSGQFLSAYFIDRDLLLWANLLFCLLSIFVFFIQKKGIESTNPNVFIRSVTAGMMIKMFAAVAAVLSYVLIIGQGYGKKTVVCSLVIYILYLIAEVYAILKQNRKKKNVPN